jgi:murein endopeptidase
VVATGDTLSHIATKHKVSVETIQAFNELNKTVIYPGQEIRIPASSSTAQALSLKAEEPSVILGQSIGRPNRGHLRRATRLKQRPGYFIRRPHRSFGAAHTVSHIEDVLAQQRRTFPKLHALAVGDLSAKRGGKITMHSSHQSGRDIDLGFYFKKRPKGYPENFVVVTAKNMHFDANWQLLSALVDLAKEDTGVDRIFMSYSSQRMFYKLARKRKISRKTLRKMFQYPAGKGALQGIIRHEPGHNEHIHVRFKCPPKDKRCE